MDELNLIDGDRGSRADGPGPSEEIDRMVPREVSSLAAAMVAVVAAAAVVRGLIAPAVLGLFDRRK